MPWVRIDEHAMEHPKVAGLPDGAFRLWVVGLSYCQKFLTDGFIADAALRSLRAFSPKRQQELLTAGLWQAADGGVAIHDFLDWNESRARVMAARHHARNRLRKYRDKHVSNAVSHSVSNGDRNAQGLVCYVGEVREKEGGVGETDLTARVRRFVDRYQVLHQQYVGVAYLGNPQKDYQAACELVAAFDDALLDAIAVFGLNDTDAFMANGTRTLTKLKSRASDYAQHLRAKRLA